MQHKNIKKIQQIIVPKKRQKTNKQFVKRER